MNKKERSQKHSASKVPGPIAHAEMSPSQEEELLLSIVRNSMDAIVSADGVIDKWNPAATKLYGYTADEAIGKPATLIVPPDKLDEFHQMTEKLEHGERIEQFDTQRMRKDGSLVDVAITVFPILDSAGKLIATSVISHDMTEQLAHMKEANRIIEKAAQLKTDFLAKMSHEIRTPLNAIIGTAELQTLSSLTQEQRRRNGIIESSGQALLTIVDDILDFSKIIAGKLALEQIDFNLAELVEGIVDTFAAIMGSKGLELAFYLDPRIAFCLVGDPNRLRQIINNLLSNAIKFTPAGEVLLRVIRVEDAANDVLVRFEIKDSGIGITPQVQSQLFQPFTQAEESTSRRYGGTGLGLVISAQLVEQMGGKIEVESEVGKGANFHFTIRLAKGAEIRRSWMTGANAAQFKGVCVLIVDDSAVTRAVIAEYLTSWEIAHAAVASSAAALEELKLASGRESKYAAVLLDEGLPSVGGLGLAEVIKNDPLLIKDTKLIMMSAETSANNSSASVDCWLTKPLRPSPLFNCLQELLVAKGEHDRADASARLSVDGLRQEWRKDVRVLVVEDNPTNQILAKEQLSVLGYTAKIVDDALQGLEALARERYDIVLMDCELPGMDGYEATRTIRRREANTRTTIVALTAHVTESDSAKCLAAGMDGYLSKPVKLKELAETLDEWAHARGISGQRMEPRRSEKPAEEELDPEALAEIAQLSKASGRNVLRKLVNDFLSDLSGRIDSIKATLDSNDLRKLAAQVHPLKSASAALGAQQFSVLCAKVEESARAGNTDDSVSLVRELLEAAQTIPGVLMRAAAQT
jgi:two-component system, sensor histidine kinase and response regulator